MFVTCNPDGWLLSSGDFCILIPLLDHDATTAIAQILSGEPNTLVNHFHYRLLSRDAIYRWINENYPTVEVRRTNDKTNLVLESLYYADPGHWGSSFDDSLTYPIDILTSPQRIEKALVERMRRSQRINILPGDLREAVAFVDVYWNTESPFYYIVHWAIADWSAQVLQRFMGADQWSYTTTIKSGCMVDLGREVHRSLCEFEHRNITDNPNPFADAWIDRKFCSRGLFKITFFCNRHKQLGINRYNIDAYEGEYLFSGKITVVAEIGGSAPLGKLLQEALSLCQVEG